MWFSCGDVCMESREAAREELSSVLPPVQFTKGLLPFLKLVEHK